MTVGLTDPIVFALQMREQHADDRRRSLLDAVLNHDEEQLAVLLEGAKEAHTKYEAVCGPDPDWTKWYAEYLLGER